MLQSKFITIRKQDLYFFLSFLFYLSERLLQTTIILAPKDELLASGLRVFRYGCYFVLLFKVYYEEMTSLHLLEILLIAGVVVLSALFSNNRDYLFWFMFLIAAKGIDFRLILKIVLLVQSIFLTFTFFFSQFGILEDYVFFVNDRVRHGLGFKWTTAAPILFLFISITYLYLRREEISIYEVVIMEAINFLFFQLTQTRLAFVFLAVVILFFWLLKYTKERDSKLWDGFTLLAPTAIAIFAIAIHWLYRNDGGIWTAANNFLTGRLSLGNRAIRTYGLSLFGQPIEWIGSSYFERAEEYNYVDCAYLQVMLQMGVVFLLMLVAMYTYILYWSIRNQDRYLRWAILFLLIFAITEPRLLQFSYNGFAFCIVTLWYEKPMTGSVIARNISDVAIQGMEVS